MNSDCPAENAAAAAAEEVLRTIYGDDFTGCTVTLESVSSIIQTALEGQSADDRQLLELYETALEGIHLLSTPPNDGPVLTPEELQSLLGSRLDAIRTLTKKIIETTTSFRREIPKES